MAKIVACLHRGKVEVLRHGQAVQRLESPYLGQLTAAGEARAEARIVSITRGRISGELCYAISNNALSGVFVQVPERGDEQQLFHGVDAQLSELDFSQAVGSLACAVAGADGTSALGVISDDGKGLRTVTEGDVIDRAPRWAPGGRSEIVYASAGIGRTRTGRAVARSPFALHRLRFSDNSVEVLMADAQYDYTAVVPVSENVLYALRCHYDGSRPSSALSRISSAFRDLLAFGKRKGAAGPQANELVRITTKGSQLVAQDVFAFDVAANEDIVYSSAAGVSMISAGQAAPERISALEDVEQLVVYS